MGALTPLLLALALGAAEPSEPPARLAWHDIAWTDLEGREWTRESLAGRVVLIDFWATWCAPCLAELPHLKDLHERYTDRGFVLIGIALDTIDRRQLRSFLHRHGVLWPQVHDPRGVEGAVANAFGVKAVPSTVIVDSSGRIVARDFRGPALDVTVEALLDLTR